MRVVLILAIITGLLAGSARAWHGRRHLSVPDLRLAWLVPVAFLPQWLAFFLPVTRGLISDDLAAVSLVGSQVLLLLFAWLNRNTPGVRLLALGLVCNLLVIAVNGGLMPISPETVTQLASDASPGSWQLGHRLGAGKDVVLRRTPRYWDGFRIVFYCRRGSPIGWHSAWVTS